MGKVRINKPDDAEQKRIEEARKAVKRMKEKIAHSKNEQKESIKKAIRNAYWESWDKLPSVWVARDDDNSLWIYDTKPIKACGMFHASGGDLFQIEGSVYPEITSENSPVKVKLLFIEA